MDWQKLSDEYAWVQPMRGCPQHPAYHGEGDVWTHTGLVLEALAASPRWRALPAAEREVVFTAAVLHDVAKPVCTRPEADGTLTSAGHARRGAVMARTLLWRLGAPPAQREQVAALVRYHMLPFWILEREDSLRSLLEISLSARCDHLSILAEADARGRVCADQAELVEDALLFAEFARERGCLQGPYAFPSEHSRFLYFRRPGRDPDYLARDETRLEVVVMSGLPGSGKDTWIASRCGGVPVVSLDEVRRELGVDPSRDQGRVAERARELAREHLRQTRPFVWNATNLSRDQRGRVLDLLADYRARIRVVCCEATAEQLQSRLEQRDPPFPGQALERMLQRWEVPDLTEAHRVERTEGGG